MNFHSRNAPARQRKNQGGGAHMPVEQEKDAAALEKFEVPRRARVPCAGRRRRMPPEYPGPPVIRSESTPTRTVHSAETEPEPRRPHAAQP